MEKWLDLHMHSYHSNDGEFSPAELMEKCFSAGLKVVALADHNTVRGVKEACETAHKLGIKFLSACEFDTTHEGKNFHLLGYGIRDEKSVFAEMEENIHGEELAASTKYMKLCHELGFKFDDSKVLAKAKNGVIVGEMIAEEVLTDLRNDGNKLLTEFRLGGKFSDNPLVNFFWEFMSQGKPAYVEMKFPKFADVVKIIKENGGAAVLAHPGANIGKNLEITKSLISTGIDGVEVYSNYHDSETKKFYAEIARENNLIPTVGSDFHGKAKPSIHFGRLEHPSPNETVSRLNKIISERGGKIIG